MERGCTNVSMRLRPMNGQLIVFEGPDAVGKSTLVKSLRSILADRQISVEFLSFPGDRPGTLGKLVYDLHHSPNQFGVSKITPISLQALHVAAHLDAIIQTIIPALSAGTWVVLDRFWWSTWVYGTADAVEPEPLDTLIETEKLLWGPFQPSVVFLVERSVPLRDEETAAQFITLSSLYKKLCNSERNKYPIVELVNMELESAQKLITQWVNERLPNK